MTASRDLAAVLPVVDTTGRRMQSIRRHRPPCLKRPTTPSPPRRARPRSSSTGIDSTHPQRIYNPLHMCRSSCFCSESPSLCRKQEEENLNTSTSQAGAYLLAQALIRYLQDLREVPCPPSRSPRIAVNVGLGPVLEALASLPMSLSSWVMGRWDANGGTCPGIASVIPLSTACLFCGLWPRPECGDPKDTPLCELCQSTTLAVISCQDPATAHWHAPARPANRRRKALHLRLWQRIRL